MFLAVQFDFWFVAEHVEGKANSLADDLSHDNFLISFLKFCKQSTTNSSSSTITPGPSGTQPLHLDIYKMDQAVREYYTTALTPATHETYEAAECKYI